ncbi:hypothetical protein BCR43DRAFT_511861 [Syncephalastrum racemosum]|uniref:C3H1-type domain-containing protein n=1 Tax=Syncephalastrum racemosum TaxID=13706 RepID=A0A1X2HNI3_SYNRA|nr:hypothetical protein BCR43DRAFT_511861 [Syncephalastrum racemosum]
MTSYSRNNAANANVVLVGTLVVAVSTIVCYKLFWGGSGSSKRTSANDKTHSRGIKDNKAADKEAEPIAAETKKMETGTAPAETFPIVAAPEVKTANYEIQEKKKENMSEEGEQKGETVREQEEQTQPEERETPSQQQPVFSPPPSAAVPVVTTDVTEKQTEQVTQASEAEAPLISTPTPETEDEKREDDGPCDSSKEDDTAPTPVASSSTTSSSSASAKHTAEYPQPAPVDTTRSVPTSATIATATATTTTTTVDKNDDSSAPHTAETTPTVGPTATTESPNHRENKKEFWSPQPTEVKEYSIAWPDMMHFQHQQHHQPQQQQYQANFPAIHDSFYSVNAGDAVAAPAAQQAQQRRSGSGRRTGNRKQRLSRIEMIEQQRQSYIPPMKSRCDYWPTCTNKNCKFRHPVKPCRAGDACSFGDRCMFLHPKDYYDQ